MGLPYFSGQRGVGRGALVPALALGWGAFLLHLGDAGRWRDDYSWGVRDAASGAWRWGAIVDLPSSWRPLAVLAVRMVLTLEGERVWIGLVLAAGAHGFAAWRLWRLMRDLAIGERAAAAATLGFVFMPWAFEVALWPAAMPTAVAEGLWLWLASIAARIADGRIGARWVWAVGAMALVIPCWNEQPATGVAALPILFVAVGRAGESMGRRLRQSVLTTLVCGAACGLYLTALALTSRPQLRGGAGSYTAAAELPGRVWEVGARGADLLVGATARDLVLGSVRMGAGAVGTWLGGLWIATVGVGAAVWLRGWAGRGTNEVKAARPGAAALFGAAVFVLGWTPLVLIRGAWAEPRLAYAPMAGFFIAGAALGSGREWKRPAMLCWGAAWTAIIIVLGVGMLGFETLKRDRARMDRSEAAMLRGLMPDPPPGAVFIAVRTEATAGTTGYRGFDRMEQSPWSWDLFGTCLLRQTYRRDDLSFVRYWPGGWVKMDEEGVRASLISRPAFERARAAERLIPWKDVVAFVIDGAGRVRLVGTLEVARPGRPGATVRIRAGGITERVEVRGP